MVATAPGHVAAVRHHVFDALTPTQVEQLRDIGEAILGRIDPEGTNALYRRSRAGDDTGSVR